MTLHFKVKTGFGGMDFISIDETELAMAQRALITGKVAMFKEGMVAGSRISAIIPDWNKELGLRPDYALTGADMGDISRARRAEYLDCLSKTNKEVELRLNGGTIIYTKEPTQIGKLIEKKK